jgi:hypothetical protein
MYSKFAKKLLAENLIRKNYMKIVFEKLIGMFCHDFNRGSKFFSKYRKFEKQALETEKDQKLRYP